MTLLTFSARFVEARKATARLWASTNPQGRASTAFVDVRR